MTEDSKSHALEMEGLVEGGTRNLSIAKQLGMSICEDLEEISVATYRLLLIDANVVKMEQVQTIRTGQIL